MQTALRMPWAAICLWSLTKQPGRLRSTPLAANGSRSQQLLPVHLNTFWSVGRVLVELLIFRTAFFLASNQLELLGTFQAPSCNFRKELDPSLVHPPR